MTYKLAVRSVSDINFSKMESTHIVTKMLLDRGYDYIPAMDPLWFGWGSKLLAQIKAIRETDCTHLLFIDARDVLVLCEPDELMERWGQLNRPWVFSAEYHIWSPNSFTPEQYPTPVDAHARYLNAGVSFGEIEHMRKWAAEWTKDWDPGKPFHTKRGDQDWWAARCVESYPDAITLDHNCSLIQCLCGAEVGPEPIVTTTPGVAYNRVTDTRPAIIHFNGGNDLTKHASALRLRGVG